MNRREFVKTHAVEALLLAAVAFAVCANTLVNGFVNDDEYQILLNPWITDLRSVPTILTGSVWGFVGSGTLSDYYRPLMHLSYLFTYVLFGYQAWAYHLVNVLVHVANTVLVYLLTVRLVGTGAQSDGRDGSRFAESLLSAPFVCALVFAVHPAHVEAVAWIAGLPDLSCALFWLTSFYLYATPGGAFGARRLVSVACFFAALLCKETALLLPALFLAHDLSSRRTAWTPGESATRYAPYAFVAGAYLLVRYQVLSGKLVSAAPAWTLSAWGKVLNAFPIFAEHLKILAWPFDLRYWRPFQPVPSALTANGLFSLGIGAAFVACAVLAWRRNRPAFLGLSMIAIPLVPMLYVSAFPRTPIAERYVYLPSVGFVLLIGLGLSRLAASRGGRIAAMVVLAGVVASYSTGTVLRNRVFKDAYTLFSDSVKKSPTTPLPTLPLAAKLLERGRAEEAIAQYRILAERTPDDATYRSLLGSALMQGGRLDEGIENLRAAISLDPTSLPSYNDLAIALKRKGQTDQAVALYEKALAIDPEYPDAHFNLGGALAERGETARALEHYRAAVKARPDDAYYRAVLGIECAQQGMLDEAIEHFQEAVRLAPNEPAYRKNLERATALNNSSKGTETDRPRHP